MSLLLSSGGGVDGSFPINHGARIGFHVGRHISGGKA